MSETDMASNKSDSEINDKFTGYSDKFISELKLKDYDYYKERLNIDRDNFTKTQKIYNKLGPLKYTSAIYNSQKIKIMNVNFEDEGFFSTIVSFNKYNHWY